MESNVTTLSATYDSFTYWFVRTGLDRWSVYSRESKELQAEGITEDSLSTDMIFGAEFALFKSSRPEYFVGGHVQESPMNELSSVYDTLVTGAVLIRAYNNGHNPDEGVNQASAILNWLHSTDFYESPASTVYHESFEGGLLLHSLKTYNNAVDLHELPKFKHISFESFTLTALVHDWCKISTYEKYMKNVKNENTGKWEQQVAYRHSVKNIPLGHGVTSMFLASKLIRLTTEESAAIRWHMGKWNVADNEMNDLQMANETYPLVHMIQFADQLSITSY